MTDPQATCGCKEPWKPGIVHREHQPCYHESDPAATARQIPEYIKTIKKRWSGGPYPVSDIPKLIRDLEHLFDYIDTIPAALEAERKAGREEEKKWWRNQESEYRRNVMNQIRKESEAEGYRRGLQEAAEMAEQPFSDKGSHANLKCYECDCHGECPQDYIAEQIRGKMIL